jgi:hypothetical protein
MPKPRRVPRIGDTVHFYERMPPRRPRGPAPAIVTAVSEWRVNTAGEVGLAVLEEAGLRFVPLVPYADAGAATGQWWAWPQPRMRAR